MGATRTADEADELLDNLLCLANSAASDIFFRHSRAPIGPHRTLGQHLDDSLDERFQLAQGGCPFLRDLLNHLVGRDLDGGIKEGCLETTRDAHASADEERCEVFFRVNSLDAGCGLKRRAISCDVLARRAVDE